MSGDHRATDSQINVFEIQGVMIFKHYFDGPEVFGRMKEYYNNYQYRFEVPQNEFEEVDSFLSEQGYNVTLREEVDKFVVVVKKYTRHPDNIFKQSIIQRSIDGFNCFLMTDQTAVESAIEEGAVRLPETSLDNPFL